MLNSRSAIISAILIAVLCLIGILAELALPPDSDGWGRDSYGVKADGIRGLFEILERLNIPVERSLVPPVAQLGRQTTIFLWCPDSLFIDQEPNYIIQIGRWVNAGGCAVVALGDIREEISRHDREKPQDVLKLLGLKGVSVAHYELDPKPDSEKTKESKKNTFASYQKNTRIYETEAVVAESSGILSGDYRSLCVPQKSVQVIELSESAPELLGQVTRAGQEPEEKGIIAATFSSGKGRITVLSDAAIFANALIGKEDNAILAATVFGRSARPIIFDEFYHGLTVRGNPVWLLTRHPWGIVTLFLLTVTAAWVWRKAVRLGPAMAEPQASRRSLREYVDAMAFIFWRGEHWRFLLEEIRRGTLWHYRERLGLAPGKEKVEIICRALEHRAPQEAEMLRRTVTKADELLAKPTHFGKKRFLDAAKEMIECLSNSTTCTRK